MASFGDGSHRNRARKRTVASNSEMKKGYWAFTMPTYVAMLRGINVSGHHVIKMEPLRKSFESLGFRNVRTYVLSGNVVFDAGKVSAANLSANIGNMKSVSSD